jgi:hypothetical protein
MSKKHKYGKADQDDLLRYIHGDLSDEERHALERALQKDLFAAEALEGLSSQHIEQVREDLEKLENQLAKRTRSRKSTMWIRAAASIALLLAVGTIYLTVFTDRIFNTGQIARESGQIEEPGEKGPESSPLTGTEKKSEKSDLPETRSVPPVPVEEEVAADGPDHTAPGESGGTPAAEVSRQATGRELIVESQVADESEIPDEEERPLAGPSGLATQPEDSTARVEFEMLAELEENQTEILDEESISDEDVSVQSGDVQSRAKRTEISRPVAMDETAARQVTGAEAPGKQASPVSMTGSPAILFLSDSTYALPVRGKQFFRQYILENLRFPEGESTGTRAGVILNFELDPDGRPVNIRIEESSGDAFSNEARRLLLEGPDWSAPSSDESPAGAPTRIRIIFN